MVIFTARERCLGQGNVFTPVILSTGGGRGLPWTETPLERDPLDRDLLDRDPPVRRYPTYWNTEMFENLLDLNVFGGDIFNCKPLTGKQVQHSATWHYVRTKDICIEIPGYLYKYWTSGST